MYIEIYHRDLKLLSRLNGGSFPKDYEKVAEIECDSLNQAWILSNSIERQWYENPEVRIVASECTRLRSCMAGDVFAIKNKFFQVSSLGFTEIELEVEMPT